MSSSDEISHVPEEPREASQPRRSRIAALGYGGLAVVLLGGTTPWRGLGFLSGSSPSLYSLQRPVLAKGGDHAISRVMKKTHARPRRFLIQSAMTKWWWVEWTPKLRGCGPRCDKTRQCGRGSPRLGCHCAPGDLRYRDRPMVRDFGQRFRHDRL
jgi:hypothetical protein